MLDSTQQGYIDEAIKVQTPVVRQFLEARHQFLNQLASLRTNPSEFDGDMVHQLAAEMGRLEMDAGRIEAEAYRKIRAAMNDEQLEAAMKMRGEYVIDEAQVASMTLQERGATLSILCSGCHGLPGQHRVGFPAPTLDGFWDRPIASANNFEFSAALTNLRKSRDQKWTPELLNEFLAGPKKVAPGTKMEFQGFLNPEDRKAVIEHLRATR